MQARLFRKDTRPVSHTKAVIMAARVAKPLTLGHRYLFLNCGCDTANLSPMLEIEPSK